MIQNGTLNKGPSTQPIPTVDWHRGNDDHLPKVVTDLARPREGWTPVAWRGRLLQLAERCEALHPQRAAELRQAAEVMIHPEEE